MSGTMIMIPTDGPEFDLIEYTLDMANELAGSVKYALDECVYSAAYQRDEEKEGLIEWQSLREEIGAQNGRLAELEATIQTTENRLQALQLTESTTRAAADLSDQEHRSATHRRLGNNRITRETAKAFLEEMDRILKSLPASLSDEPGNPPVMLQEQYRWFQKRLDENDIPDGEELAGLQQLVQDTLRAHAKRIEQRQKNRQRLQQRLEPLLDTLLFTHKAALAAQIHHPDLMTEMSTLRRQLLALCQEMEPVEGAIDFLERRIPEIQKIIDKLVVNQMQRRGLSSATLHHLTEMGYTVVQDFEASDSNTMMQARLRIPGGEQVHVVLHANLHMAFEVIHERGPGEDPDAVVSVAEQMHFMRQEKRWCQDHRELMRRLIAEGFPYRVSFERHILETSIKVVIVESAEELAQRDESIDDDIQEQRTFD